jgi:hypothetical protein
LPSSAHRELEEENRLLRQRDIMHRLIELDQLEAASGDGVKGGLGVNKEQLATFNTPSMSVTGAFAVQLDRQIEESEVRREVRRKASAQRLSSGQPHGQPSVPQRRWSLLRMAFLSKRAKGRSVARGSGFAAARGSLRRVNPAPKPTKKVLSREDQATIKIQAVWRGKMVRDELAFGYGDEHAYGY